MKEEPCDHLIQKEKFTKCLFCESNLSKNFIRNKIYFVIYDALKEYFSSVSVVVIKINLKLKSIFRMGGWTYIYPISPGGHLQISPENTHVDSLFIFHPNVYIGPI